MTIPEHTAAVDAETDTDTTARDQTYHLLNPSDTFVHRHIGPDADEIQKMLGAIGFETLEEMVDAAVPDDIRMSQPLKLDRPRGEHELLDVLRAMARKNQVFRSYIGMGYYDTITPPAIQSNILQNPGWYSAYTPYQAEISQGRLEALLNFQTMVSDLTGLPLANASLLDEGTAAAEAMTMCLRVVKKHDDAFFVADDCHPQTIDVVRGRAKGLGIDLEVNDVDSIDFDKKKFAGVLVQYPNTSGEISDYRDLIRRAHEAGVLVVMATDLLALTLLKPPGELGADIAIGSSQRFGVPMGAGGPHAAFFATLEKHARKTPGRIIGVSRDAEGNIAYRMAIQTREQHIKRERATSNICTAQVLLAVMASMYAVYHGPDGLRRIAQRVHASASALAEGLRRLGHDVHTHLFFDTIRVRPKNMSAEAVLDAARRRHMNLRDFADGTVGISINESTEREDLRDLLAVFTSDRKVELDVDQLAAAADEPFPHQIARTSEFLTHPVFNTHHAEPELIRYIKMLEARDLSLTTSMIPLGSCTMKHNAASEMMPVIWPGFSRIHPFAPREQTQGYAELYDQLERWLAEITGFDAVALQPNAGSQGEYAGLRVIRAYHESVDEGHRNVCLIPTSAHGTNPASAVMAGYKVVGVPCDDHGNIDLDQLRQIAEQHKNNLGAYMITFPSTFGVFEDTIAEMCRIIHECGGLVYLDGANMNAQCGICRPGDYGADVAHLNLHKTFCIPHGGGGPGMGPIGVVDKLKPFLPGHPINQPHTAGEHAIEAISAAPYGSPSILPISWMYIALMGSTGLTRASQVAILAANYMAKRLEEHYDVVYRGRNGLVAHEFIVDCRAFDKSADVQIDDIAKRLMDYGFHAPTMSWPVPGTLMIEPTESEPLAELDQFCDAMIAIREEIRAIENGEVDREDNVLKNAPHTVHMVTAEQWTHPYPRQQAAFPDERLRPNKFWPAVARVDNPYGDRNLMCSCPPMDAYCEGRFD